MKRTLALLLGMLILCFALVSCSKNPQSDSEYIINKGTLRIAVTEYEPMNYKEAGTDKWTGFDTEFAEAFCEKIGVKAEFIAIEWDNRFSELKSKSIDCIWNGMTISDDAKNNTSVTNPYVKNAQVLVMKNELASQYARAEDLSNLKIAVEQGSAGESAVRELSYEPICVDAQSTALMEVASGSADACVIDITMANAMTGEGTSYDNLTIALYLNEEEYGVSFRTGSDMVEKWNAITAEFMSDGTLDRLAEKYNTTLIK